MGSVSNGLVTDTRWKCFGLKSGELARNLFWRKTADVSHWPQAFAIHANRGDSPWGKTAGISEDAFWISTVEEDHSKLFCRRRLSDLPPVITEKLSEGIFQATIDDVGYSLRNHTKRHHQVHDVMDCFEKCLADPQCLSFNFEHDSVLPTRKCELNGVTKGQDPRNYVRRPGYTYYDRV
ncbi:hypothetical protein AWC38_SpisGene7152 [Stylophora pistillata]|uniref:Apple domain-containing protein n=2 Tax=Stylophora pistillata TaxID=50429 RepID=A0A2B4SFG4_STYPI|nr:hypothetical protein AWC38_SpisGene7152 [Stylophora pistillata]